MSGGMGFTPTKMIVFGESAGGNMAAALCLKLIQEDNATRPNGLVLVYPALNLHLSPSPSRFLHQNDPVLPRGVLELALNSYYPQHQNNQYTSLLHDPLASPGAASTELLRLLPRTDILVGDLDPL